MSMLDVLKNHKPVENSEFGAKKKLVGDAVAQVQEFTKKTAKDGRNWLILKCAAIHCIPDAKGRETTVKPGDEITKVYGADDADALADLDNDFFTAAFSYEKEVADEDALIAGMSQASVGKLIYFRTWAKDKNEEQMEKNPSPSFFQNVKIMPAKLITPENSEPQMPF